MRILWVTSNVFEVFFPFVEGKPTRGGSWIAPLFYSIYQQQNVKLGSITPVINGVEQKKEIDDVTYYSIPISKNENLRDMNGSLINAYLRVINDFKPEIIHIHGIENNFGLLRKYVDRKIPIVCSIQGIISPWLTFMKYSIADTDIRNFRSIKNRLGRGGVDGALRKMKKFPAIEKEVFRLNQY